MWCAVDGDVHLLRLTLCTFLDRGPLALPFSP